MLRGLLSTVAAVVLTATLLWGGCVSCQPLTAPKAAAQSCCDAQGKCKTPARPDVVQKACRNATPALEQYGPAAPEPTAEPPVAEVALVLPLAPVEAVPAIDTGPSPPDLVLLTASFRI